MKFSILFVFLFVNVISFAKSHLRRVGDSSLIVSLFSRSLKNVNDSDSLIKVASKIVESENSDCTTLNDTYLYNYSKFLFSKSQLEKADSVAKLGLVLYTDFPLNYKSSKFHNIIGTVLMFQNKHELAIKEFQKAITILELNNDNYQAALVKNNIANMFFSLTDYESSYKYSSSTYKTLRAVDDTVYLPGLTGVFAISAIKLNKFTEGKKLAVECLELSDKYNNVLGLIVGNHSLGELYLNQNNYENSSLYFFKSLKISESIKNAHYIMLNKVGLLNLYVKARNYRDALVYGTEALKESKQMNNVNTLYNIRKNLGYTYYGLKEYKKAFNNLDSAHNMYRAFANLENKKAINDILVKYDTEKKEKEIVQNKLVIAQGEIDLNKRKLWIFALAVLVLFLVISYYFYNRFQKQKILELKKEEEKNIILALVEGEEKERERISNELHDGMASSITGIKIKLEHLSTFNPNSDLDSLVRQLAVLHEETRRVSHNLMPISLKDTSFLRALENYCIENSTVELKIIFSNLLENDLFFQESIAIILYRICQELINNVKKHARTGRCFVQVSFQKGKINISIEDEGEGFDTSKINSSQGLRSVKKRLGNLGGELIVNSKINEGTLTVISIPA